MRFYNGQHPHGCGIDLHARTMYVCILDAQGQGPGAQEPEGHTRRLPGGRGPLPRGPRRRRRVHLHRVLDRRPLRPRGGRLRPGPRALHEGDPRGKAKNDRVDALEIATLLRGGLLPQAYAYPAGMRATRDLLRRRLHLVRKRGQLLAHIQMTAQQYNLPALEKRLAYPANREGVAEHFPDRAVRRSIEVDLALLERYDELLRDLELDLVRQAKQHDPQAFQLLRSIPGVGKVLALTILYEIHDVHRFGRVQEFASYARLVKCAKESAGKKHGTSGAKMGNVHLKWAFSEAAVMFVRHSPEGKKALARLEKRFGKGKALSVLAHKLGRAVYFILRRGRAFDGERLLATMN